MISFGMKGGVSTSPRTRRAPAPRSFEVTSSLEEKLEKRTASKQSTTTDKSKECIVDIDCFASFDDVSAYTDADAEIRGSLDASPSAPLSAPMLVKLGSPPEAPTAVNFSW